jgi:hypothetical protein
VVVVAVFVAAAVAAFVVVVLPAFPIAGFDAAVGDGVSADVMVGVRMPVF